MVLRTIKKCSTVSYNNVPYEFQNLKKSIKKIAVEFPDENKFFSYNEMVAWIKHKAEKKPLLECYKEAVAGNF